VNVACSLRCWSTNAAHSDSSVSLVIHLVPILSNRPNNLILAISPFPWAAVCHEHGSQRITGTGIQRRPHPGSSANWQSTPRVFGRVSCLEQMVIDAGEEKTSADTSQGPSCEDDAVKSSNIRMSKHVAQKGWGTSEPITIACCQDPRPSKHASP
jgi:hypothetical protein